MKRLTLIVAVVLFSLPASVFAAPPRLAVGDFSVTSDDPRLKYVGKGLADVVDGTAEHGLVFQQSNQRRGEAGVPQVPP